MARTKQFAVYFHSDVFDKKQWNPETQQYGSYEHFYGNASTLKTAKGYISRIRRELAKENPHDFRIYDSWGDVDPATHFIPCVYQAD